MHHPRQDSTYHSLCYTSRGALAGMGPPHQGSIRRPIAPWANALTTELHLTTQKNHTCNVSTHIRSINMVAISKLYIYIFLKEGNVLFSNALNTFYLQLYGVRHMIKDHWAKEETCCCHMSYSFWLATRVLLYALSHRQDKTYHNLCYTSCEALAGIRNSSMCPPWRIDPTTHRTMSERYYHGATSHSSF